MARLQYRPLDYPSYEIRLLRLLPAKTDCEHSDIECNLQHFSLLHLPQKQCTHPNSRPEYIALSYCWGVVDATEAISVNGCEFQAGKNLVAALRELRKPQRAILWLWVDAICINQHDIGEKGARISRMGRIFARARQVIAWTGPHDGTSAQAFEAVDIIAPLFRDKNPALLLRESEISSLRGVCYIRLLFERPYWRRKWIIQELSKASTVSVICGNSTVSLRNVIIVCVAPAGRHIAPPETRDLLISLQQFRMRERPRSTLAPRMSLSEALIKTWHSKASDRRDCVFSLLDLTKDGNDLVPMPNYYQSPERTFLELSWNMLALQRQSPLMLLVRGDPIVAARSRASCDHVSSASPAVSETGDTLPS